MRIFIGEETGLAPMDGVSVVTAPYLAGGQVLAFVAFAIAFALAAAAAFTLPEQRGRALAE